MKPTAPPSEDRLAQALLALRGEQFYCVHGLRAPLVARWGDLNERGRDDWRASARRLTELLEDEQA